MSPTVTTLFSKRTAVRRCRGRPVNSPPDVNSRGDLAHHRWVSSTDPPTRPGVPLKDRPLGDNESTPSQAPAKEARRRHCFVTLDEGETEGLVLQWAQDSRGWVALVVYVVPRTGGDLTVQEWLPAAQLRPAST